MAQCVECKKALRNEQAIWCRDCVTMGRVPDLVLDGLRERRPDLVPKPKPENPAPRSRFRRKAVI